jgi:hypothetical protein
MREGPHPRPYLGFSSATGYARRVRPLRLAMTTVAMVVLVVGATSAAASPDATSPLVGTWRTGVISQSDAQATLRRYGLAKWAARFRRETPFTQPIALILTIRGGEWNLYGKPRGKSRFKIDYDAEYVVKGATVDKIHKSGFTTLGWSVKGRVLRLRWLKTTESPYRGIPDVVFQRALYMTRNFVRQS